MRVPLLGDPRPRSSRQVAKAVALLAVLAGLSIAGTSAVSSVPNVFGPIQWASNETHPRWVLNRPPRYPNPYAVAKEDLEKRREFYISEAAVMAAGCMALVVVAPLLPGTRRQLTLPDILPLQVSWLVANEAIDSAAVTAVVLAHGVLPQFGLYWEDWIVLYSVILSAVVAQFTLGAVALDNAGMAVFPPTSARFVRVKDKVSVALLLSQGVAGALLAAVALVIIFGNQVLMLRYFPDDYVPAFFVVSIQAEARILDRGTWHDWAMQRVEAMTRDGKVAHVATHDVGIAIVTVGLWLLCGGTPFVVLSLALTAARVVLLPLGRLLVLQRLDEWGKMYLLRARLYGWAAAAAARCSRRWRARWMGRQAWDLCLAGRTPEALDIRREVVQLRREVLGERHPDTLGAMNNLGVSLSETGRLDEALDIRREVLQISREVLGERHPETLRAMGNLGISLGEAGRLDEALDIEGEVLQLKREVLGERHPDTLLAMNNLGVSLSRAGRLDEALDIRREVLQLLREVLGERHPETLTAMNNLGVSLSQTGRQDEALDIKREVLQLSREVLGERHPGTLRAMGNLSFSLYRAGRLDEALDMQREAVQLSREVLGEQHPDTVLFEKNLDGLERARARELGP